MKKLIRRLRILARAAMGREILIRPDIKVEKERFGSEYGGWDVIRSAIDPNSVVYSFGIGEDASFDMALIDRFDVTVHGFDPTPRSIEWVGKQGFSNKFVMHGYGIASFDGTVSFNPPEDPGHVSHTMLDRPSTHDQALTVPVKRLKTIMKELNHTRIDLLKMDIEGAEYDVVDELCRSEIRPYQLLVEFHHRFPGVGVGKTRNAIESIRHAGYRLFSVAPSNEEFCFVYQTD